MVRSKKDLAIFLSRLEIFEKPSRDLEQYPTDGDIAAQVLWEASNNGHIDEKHIIDLGCGTGILGIGALLLGAKSVEFIDVDPRVYPVLKKNLAILTDNWEIDIENRWSFSNKNVAHAMITPREDAVVIMNPPFGTKQIHADREFLSTAIKIAPVVYSMHKTTTENFLHPFIADNNFSLFWKEEVLFPIKQTMTHHTKRLQRVEVILIGIKKK